MKSRTMAALPAALVLAPALGCSSGPTGREVASSAAQDITPCPSRTSQDDQMRGAATLALDLMKSAAEVGGANAPTFSNTVLSSQRYRVQSSGTGIEFDPNDPLYRYVSNKMKAHLAFAQLDGSVAQFLSDGLRYAYTHSDGWFFPSFGGISALANFRYPGPSSVHVPDSTSQNDSHTATATGQAWCGTQKVTIAESVQASWAFSPMYSLKITNPGVGGGGWLSMPPAAFTGGVSIPTTPFNGASASGNPYLVVSVNGQATNWATYNFNPANCWANPQPWQCNGSVELDPVPYAEPGDYYDPSGNLMGMQSNPFQLEITVLFADPDHASQWATRTAGGNQQWGTFSNPISILGYTMYKYVKQY